MPTCDTLIDSLELEFRAACTEFAEARSAQQTKDTPAARLRLAECAAVVDAVLDARNAGRSGLTSSLQEWS